MVNFCFQLFKDNITSPANISGRAALVTEVLFPSAGQETQTISVQSLGDVSNPTVFDYYPQKKPLKKYWKRNTGDKK